jgi:hypothetical protein
MEALANAYIARSNAIEAHPYRWTYTGDVLAA